MMFLILWNPAGVGTAMAKGLAERYRSLKSSMLWNLAGDDTTLAEDLAERCRSIIPQCFEISLVMVQRRQKILWRDVDR